MAEIPLPLGMSKSVRDKLAKLPLCDVKGPVMFHLHQKLAVVWQELASELGIEAKVVAMAQDHKSTLSKFEMMGFVLDIAARDINCTALTMAYAIQAVDYTAVLAEPSVRRLFVNGI